MLKNSFPGTNEFKSMIREHFRSTQSFFFLKIRKDYGKDGFTLSAPSPALSPFSSLWIELLSMLEEKGRLRTVILDFSTKWIPQSPITKFDHNS